MRKREHQSRGELKNKRKRGPCPTIQFEDDNDRLKEGNDLPNIKHTRTQNDHSTM